MPTAHRPLLLLLPLLLMACASDRGAREGDVGWLVSRERYEEAVRVAAREAAARPNDERAAALHREATVAWHLSEGRRLTFDDRDEQALESFRLALALAPDSEIVAGWIDKTEGKLARTWLGRALDLHANDDVAGALEAYDQALRYRPADQGALAGRTLAALLHNHRLGRGRGYFQEGLRAFSGYWLELARSRFSYSEKYLPDDTRPQDRRVRVDVLLSEQRLVRARTFESQGRWGAARGEYRATLTLDAGSEEAREGAERCQVEMEVAEDLRMARMDLVRGRLDAAIKRVERACERTVKQREACDSALIDIREYRLKRAYEEALTLERDFRYEEAVERYDRLLVTAEYYADVFARRDTLRGYISLAGELYQRALAAEGDAERLGLLSQIRVFWPGYRDVEARVQALEAAEQPRQP